MKLKTWSIRDIGRGTKVFLRIDGNVSVKNGKVVDNGRLESALPEIERLRKRGARIILATHLGKPGGKTDLALSTKPVAQLLAKLLREPIAHLSGCRGEEIKRAIDGLKPGQMVMLENLRFESGEEKNSLTFAKALAALADVYVNDAFGVCHREHASVHAIAQFLPSFAGELVVHELKELDKPLKHPVTLLLGGAKLETKVKLLEHLGGKIDALLLGGAAALPFIESRMGSLPVAYAFSVVDKKLTKQILKQFNDKLITPIDVTVAKGGQEIVDIGPDTAETFVQVLRQAKTVIWNGTLGITEHKEGREGSLMIARALATMKGARIVVGGGDTVDFLRREGLVDAFSFVSTGGGAMLAYIAGQPMPGLESLML